MIEKPDDIKNWEIVFQSLLVSGSLLSFLTLMIQGDILHKVSNELWDEYGEDDAGPNAPGEFSDIAKSFQLGQLCLALSPIPCMVMDALCHSTNYRTASA